MNSNSVITCIIKINYAIASSLIMLYTEGNDLNSIIDWLFFA
jgi:hypothetical protein